MLLTIFAIPVSGQKKSDRGVLNNALLCRFGTKQNAGNSTTRMRACSDKVQPADLFAPVVRAEQGALRQPRFNAERVAEKCVQLLFDFLRCS